ncbi:MAG: hypothetical protein K6T30_03195, partial [Alicyclobacillus sp.]|nr:hypothetical protein [Alicyclobacillus sp.]
MCSTTDESREVTQVFALVCKDGAAEVLAQCDGVLDVQVVTSMSELRRLVAEGHVEGVFVDARLNVASAIRQRLPGVPVYEYIPPFRIADAMRWHEQTRRENTAAPKIEAPQP